jgi:hypothetical protein
MMGIHPHGQEDTFMSHAHSEVMSGKAKNEINKPLQAKDSSTLDGLFFF